MTVSLRMSLFSGVVLLVVVNLAPLAPSPAPAGNLAPPVEDLISANDGRCRDMAGRPEIGPEEVTVVEEEEEDEDEGFAPESTPEMRGPVAREEEEEDARLVFEAPF